MDRVLRAGGLWRATTKRNRAVGRGGEEPHHRRRHPAQPSPGAPSEAGVPQTLREDGVQGVVRIIALIGRDGRVTPREAVSGPEALRPLAFDAVKQWLYEPVRLNGEAVEVLTQIDVNFSLNQ